MISSDGLVIQLQEEVDRLNGIINNLPTITSDMKARCIGEFKEYYEFFSEDTESIIDEFIVVSWHNTKAIYTMMLAQKLSNINEVSK